MDALSALKMAMTPQAGGLSANPMQSMLGGAGGAIPAADMQQLTASMGGGFSPASAQNMAASMTPGLSTSPLTQQIGSVNNDAPLAQSTTNVESGSGANFENLLGGMIGDVAQKQAAASNTVNGLLSGQNVSLHQAMISMEEANVSFQMMVEVRNRLMDGYQELMRMQI
jgi:flagellar hook-basal body complex protein FliE